MKLFYSIAGWLVFSAVFMSFAEHVVHRYMMHRKGLPRFIYKLIAYWGAIYEEHALLHHGKYYKTFNDEPDPEGKHLNLKLNVLLGFLFSLPFAGIIYFFSAVGSIIFVAVVIFHHFAWNIIHTEMHVPKPRFFSRLAIYKFLARYHYMHHIYPGRNFNVVLPFADFLLGAVRRPSEKDRLGMEAIGLA
ncbi:MAG: hypothetical protein AB1757_17025 [Acidobacteriota bacterium]